MLLAKAEKKKEMIKRKEKWHKFIEFNQIERIPIKNIDLIITVNGKSILLYNF